MKSLWVKSIWVKSIWVKSKIEAPPLYVQEEFLGEEGVYG